MTDSTPRCYVDHCCLHAQAIIDLLIPGQSPGIKEQLVDLYGKSEMLFFGPDGTRVHFFWKGLAN